MSTSPQVLVAVAHVALEFVVLGRRRQLLEHQKHEKMAPHRHGADHEQPPLVANPNRLCFLSSSQHTVVSHVTDTRMNRVPQSLGQPLLD